MRLAPVLLLAAAAACGKKPQPPSADWTMYGHDLHHSFTAVAANINVASGRSLKEIWSYPTGDAVSASPAVVNGVVYVGSWDGYFYALNATNGSLIWKFPIDCQNSIAPIPTQCLAPGQTPPNREYTEGGLMVSSPTVLDGKVYFGGGKTLYCLNTADGSLVWKKVICGNPDEPNCEADANDQTILFSSPALYAGKILLGHTAIGTSGYRGGFVALDQGTGDLIWSFETDPILDANGNPVLGPNGLPSGGLNRGCGAVWGTGAVDETNSLVFFGTGDCADAAPPPYHEALLALDIDTGVLKWVYRAGDTDPCDFDIGASPNVLDLPSGRAVGVGSKDGTYYAVDAKSGQLLWKTNVVFGGASGGFIGSTAFDGTHVFGATAYGELGEASRCVPSNPRDQIVEDPSFHAFDAATGTVAWELNKAYSFGPTTVSNDLLLNGSSPALGPQLSLYDIPRGELLKQSPMNGALSSGITVVGNGIYFGTGNSNDGSGSAIHAWALP